MENDTRDFFVLIAKTISFILMWMMINVLLGIYFGFGFFDDVPDWKNIIYYIWLIGSLFFLVKYIRRKWKF